MTIQVELWQLASLAAVLILAIVVAFWVLATVIGRQITSKFEQITVHLGQQDTRLTALEKQMTELRVELARDYVHHNDYTRDIGTLATKFEALALNVERVC